MAHEKATLIPGSMEKPESPTDASTLTSSVNVKLRKNGVDRSHRERLYTCNICRESFTRSEHRRRHELCHRNQKPFACLYCNLKSSRQDVISRHTKKFHRHINEETNHFAPTTVRNEGANTANGIEQSLLMSYYPVETQNSPVIASNLSTSKDTLECGNSQNAVVETLTSPLTDAYSTTGLASTYNDTAESFAITGNQLSFSSDIGGLDSWMNFQILDDYLFQYSLNSLPIMPPVSNEWKVSSNLGMESSLGTNTYSEFQTNGLFSEVSNADIEVAKAQVTAFDIEGRLSSFCFPTRYRAIRFLKGFFHYFSPHTPIVHRETFSFSTSPAPLLLTVLACGAIHMNVAEIGFDLHQAALKLLAENDDLVNAGEKESGFQLWEFQARLLACQFGLFSGDDMLQRQARLAFSRLPDLAESAKLEARVSSSSTWKSWIYVETINRCVAWTGVLGAVLMSNEEVIPFRFRADEPDIALPCTEVMWSSSSNEWVEHPQTEPFSFESFRKLLDSGGSIENNISPFGLLSLISSILHYVCMMKNFDKYCLPQSSYLEEASIEKALNVWEEAWKLHPLSHSLPEAPQGPLMADSIVILNSAYYHLYASRQLKALKAFARLPTEVATQAELDQLCKLPCHTGLLKALNRALRILLLRVRVGIRYLVKTAPLSYVCYGSYPAYEGALLVFWYFLRSSVLSEVLDPVLLNLLEEIITESEGEHEISARKELLPLMIYQEILREKWVWKSGILLGQNMGSIVHRIEGLTRSTTSDSALT